MKRAIYNNFMNKQTLVVASTYNEKDNIEDFLDGIWSHLDTDVVIIDDNSPDGTGNILDQIAQRDSRLKVIHRPRKMGITTAILTGIHHGVESKYAYIFTMDADGSHNAKYLLPMLNNLNDVPFGVCVGSRLVKGGGIVGRNSGRDFLTTWGNFYIRTILQLKLHDCTSGFRCMTLAAASLVVNNIQVSSQGYGMQIEFNYAWANNYVPCLEFPIVFEDRKFGVSKMTKGIILESLLVVWKLRFQKNKSVSTAWQKEHLQCTNNTV